MCLYILAPLNVKEFKSVGQTETSITLQWNKVDDILNYTLVFNGSEINVTASGKDQVTYIHSGLTSGTKYDFTLFTVFEYAKSSGVNLTAVTGKMFFSLIKPNNKSQDRAHVIFLTVADKIE